MTNDLLYWKYRVLGPVYEKGGGGGGGYVDTETPRRQAAISYINELFGGRETRRPAYEQHAGNVRQFHQQAIDEDYTIAQRELRDALARQGLSGGSADIDQSALVGRKKSEGYLEAGRKADAAAADLEAADEQTKQGLINQINAGLDQASAGNALYSGMQATRERAASADLTNRINNFFRNIGAIYETQQVPGMVAAGKSAQQQQLSQFLNPTSGYKGRG
ncbi:MAG: hypothetical protein IT349_19260 [Candidatus Eisenbacteria bacterium]|nr:hypothetical protein [Candidatus Eisenbacteria bacterium]